MSVDVYIRTGIQVQVTPQVSPTYYVGNLPVLVSTGQAYASQAWVDSGYYPRNNPSGYATGIDGSLYVRRTESGQFVTTGQTGVFITTGQTGNFALASQLGLVVYVTGNQVISGSKTFSGQVNLLDGVDANAIDFTGVAPAWQEGRVFYDAASHTLAYYNDSPAVTVNLGQE